jgi:hypothetical protein
MTKEFFHEEFYELMITETLSTPTAPISWHHEQVDE